MPLSDADKIVNLEDLAAFKVKMDESVLHKTGAETVSGEKVFSGIQTTAAGNETALIVVKDATLTKGEMPAVNHYLSLGFIDSTGDSYAQDTASRLGVVEYKSPSDVDPEGYVQMVAMGFSGGLSARLQVGHDKDNIRYATAPATSDDRTNSTDIVTRGYMEASEWNWQKTSTAQSVAFKPVPESDLEPVVKFACTEIPPAEGDKGVDNPSTITGVSSATVTHCEIEDVDSTDYTISFGNTYYGGSLDVATGVMTVTHQGVVFDGTENWNLSSALTNVTRFNLSGVGTSVSNRTQTCTHFVYDYNYNSDSVHFYISTTGSAYIFYPDPEITKDNFKAFLAEQYAAGTPVTMIYEFATPLAVQLTPTQIKSLAALDKYEPRINTVYTDQEAVQVGYQRFYDENRIAAIEARLDAIEAQLA